MSSAAEPTLASRQRQWIAVALLLTVLDAIPIALYLTLFERAPALGVHQAADLAGRLEASAPFIESSTLEQWAVSMSAFGVKPLYMLLTLALIVVLRGSNATDLAMLRWGDSCSASVSGFLASPSSASRSTVSTSSGPRGSSLRKRS
jgi:hypothetical protein